ncbi:hypothetical protein DPMN_032142 [Dreissena polymorpha]|uniref:B box-type domain-containing protein n=1 Tax=Dreissena polymorpha TaxID=45954 RepID=A0A9D4M175_DREPO|nr:hypothetical protein DPMN_032142 [Dreissena polymorpha]
MACCNQHDVCNSSDETASDIENSIAVKFEGSSISTLGTGMDEDSVDLFRCPVHKENKLAFYCKTHKQSCCVTCALCSHMTCSDIHDINDVVGQDRTVKQHWIHYETKLSLAKELLKRMQTKVNAIRFRFPEELFSQLRNKTDKRSHACL